MISMRALIGWRIAAVITAVTVLMSAVWTAHVPRLFNKKTELNILTWAGIIDLDVLREFEQQHNAQVNLVYFESNEELAAKLAIARTAQYDLITPTDVSLAHFVQAGLVEPVDISRIERWQDMHPRLREFGRLRDNYYALPFAVILYGIGMQAEHATDDASWSLLFEKPQGYNIGLTDDPVDLLNVVSQYKLGNVEHLADIQVADLYEMLKKQKRWVEAYSEIRADYFLMTGACRYILAPSYAIQLAHKHGNNLVMRMPREGGFIITDQLAIARGTAKHDLVYKFLNWVLKHENLACATQEHGWLPPFESELALLDTHTYLNYTPQDIYTKLYATVPRMKQLIEREKLNRLWIRLKA